jgi:hypothetical protein
MLKKLDIKVITVYLVVYIIAFYALSYTYNACYIYAYKDGYLFNYLFHHKPLPQNVDFTRDIFYATLWAKLNKPIVFLFITIVSYAVFYIKLRKYVKELTVVLFVIVLIQVIKVGTITLLHH